VNKPIRLSDEDLRSVYESLPQAFRAIRALSQKDINSRALIFESAYNQVAASRDRAFAAQALAGAMAVLEEQAAAGGWKIPERLVPIAEDCRRARR
jgi:hypothetical protein